MIKQTQRATYILLSVGVVGVALLFYAYHSLVPLELPDVTDSTSSKELKTLQARVESPSARVLDFVRLIGAYNQTIRETADTALYSKMETLLAAGYERFGADNPELMAAEATVALGLHQFDRAYALASRCIETNPRKADYHGLLGDAALELGLYEEATTAYQQMIDIRPDYDAYIRVAYLRELYGDVTGAALLLEQAISSGSSKKEHLAFAYTEWGRLLFSVGEYDEASAKLAEALTWFKQYPSALYWQGMVAVAKEDLDRAEAFFQEAFTVAPTVTNAETLFYFYTRVGNTALAEKYFTLTDVAYKHTEATGSVVDLEYGRFLLIAKQYDEANERAHKAYDSRQTIYTSALLASVLMSEGKPQEAKTLSQQALTLETKDSLLLFERAQIEMALQNTIAAKQYAKQAYELNPHFSLFYSPQLVELVATLP